MRQHYTFRLSRGPAGEDHRRGIVERGRPEHSQKKLQQSHRQQFRGKQRADLFAKARVQSQIFRINQLARRLHRHFFQKLPRGNHGF